MSGFTDINILRRRRDSTITWFLYITHHVKHDIMLSMKIIIKLFTILAVSFLVYLSLPILYIFVYLGIKSSILEEIYTIQGYIVIQDPSIMKKQTQKLIDTNQDVSKCLKFKSAETVGYRGVDYTSGCISIFALQKKKVSLCKLISNPNEFDKCVYSFAIESNDFESCELLLSSSAKTGCQSKLK